MLTKLVNLGYVGTGTTPSMKNPDYYNSDDILFIKPSDLNDNEVTEITKSEFFISNSAKQKARIFPKNTVLCVCIGSIGKIGITTKESSCNQQINYIIPNEKHSAKYLAYSLLFSKDELIRIASDGTVVPIINKTRFEKIEIVTFDYDTETKIANELDNIKNSIAFKQKEIDSLNELVKSRFIEMFGEEKNKELISSACNRVTDFVASGSFASIKENVKYYDNEGYAILVKTADFANGFTKGLTYTDKHGYDFLKNSNLYGGELILPNIGASIGKAFIVPKLNVPMSLAPNSIMIEPSSRYKTEFLYYYFLSDFGQEQLKGMITATAMPKFNKTQLKSLEILAPKIDKQIEFAKFANKVDKSKFIVQKEIELLQELLDKKMNEYFGN